MAKDKVGFEILVEHAKGAKNLKDFVKNLENLDDEQKKSANSAIKAYKGVKKFGDGAKESEAGISKLKGTVAKLGGVMALVGTVKAGVGISSELEDYKNTLEVVMKDTQKAGDMFEWAVKKANKTPFDTKDVVEGAVRLESYGLSAKKMMDGIGDMAAVMNTDLMQAVEAVADAQNGELERLKEYGITKKKIVEQANKMGFEGLVNNKGQITDLEKFNLALMELMKNNFAGGMERKAKSFSGAMSTISGVTKTSIATLMGVDTDGSIAENSIFDVLRDSAVDLSNGLIKLQESGKLAEWGEGIATTMKKGGDFAREYGDEIINLSQSLGILWGAYKSYTIIGGVTKAFEKAKMAQEGLTIAQWAHNALLQKSSAYEFATKVLTLAKSEGIATAAQWAWNTALNANPIGLVVAGVVALGGAAYMVWKNWDTLKKKTLSLWDALDDNPLGKVIKFFFKWMTPVGQLVNGLKELYTWYKKVKGEGDNLGGEQNTSIEHVNTIRKKYGLDPVGGEQNDTSNVDGSHRNGLANVPRDGYRAELHEGERVLTKRENREYKSSKDISIYLGGIHINGINKNAQEMAKEVLGILVPQLKIALKNM